MLGEGWNERGTILESAAGPGEILQAKLGSRVVMSLKNVLQSCSISKSSLGDTEMGTRQHHA